MIDACRPDDVADGLDACAGALADLPAVGAMRHVADGHLVSGRVFDGCCCRLDCPSLRGAGGDPPYHQLVCARYGDSIPVGMRRCWACLTDGE